MQRLAETRAATLELLPSGLCSWLRYTRLRKLLTRLGELRLGLGKLAPGHLHLPIDLREFTGPCCEIVCGSRELRPHLSLRRLRLLNLAAEPIPFGDEVANGPVKLGTALSRLLHVFTSAGDGPLSGRFRLPRLLEPLLSLGKLRRLGGHFLS